MRKERRSIEERLVTKTMNETLPLKVKLCLMGACAVIILLLFVVVGMGSASRATSRIVQLGLENIGQLTTQAGFFTNVQVLEDVQTLWGWNLPLTHSKYIFSYDGTVNAGIDFDKIGISANPVGKTITVTLPEAEIFSIEIDPESLEIYDESKSVFTPLTIEDVNDSLIAVKDEAMSQCIGNGILEKAQNNAKILIESFISKTYDLSEYIVEYVQST